MRSAPHRGSVDDQRPDALTATAFFVNDFAARNTLGDHQYREVRQPRGRLLASRCAHDDEGTTDCRRTLSWCPVGHAHRRHIRRVAEWGTVSASDSTPAAGSSSHCSQRKSRGARVSSCTARLPHQRGQLVVLDSVSIEAVMFHDRIAVASDVRSGKRQTKNKRSSPSVNKVGRAVEHYGLLR